MICFSTHSFNSSISMAIIKQNIHIVKDISRNNKEHDIVICDHSTCADVLAINLFHPPIALSRAEASSW